jgi:hypothetical protein
MPTALMDVWQISSVLSESRIEVGHFRKDRTYLDDELKLIRYKTEPMI